jgi:hypothetical protein
MRGGEQNGTSALDNALRRNTPIRKLTYRRRQVELFVADALLQDPDIFRMAATSTMKLDNFLSERGIRTYLEGEFGLQQYVINNDLREQVQSQPGANILMRSVPVQSVHLPRCGTPEICNNESTCFGDETMDQVYQVLSSVRNDVQYLLEAKPELVSAMLSGVSELTGMKAELLRTSPVTWIERSDQGVHRMRTQGYHRQGSRTCAPGQSDCNVVRLSANATIRYSGQQNRVHSFILLRLGVVIRLTDSKGRHELHPVNLADIVLPQYDDYRCEELRNGGEALSELQRIGRDLQFQVQDLMDQNLENLDDLDSWNIRLDRLEHLLAFFNVVLTVAQAVGAGRKSRTATIDAIAVRFRSAGMSAKIAEVAAQLAMKGLKRARTETKTPPKKKEDPKKKNRGAK